MTVLFNTPVTAKFDPGDCVAFDPTIVNAAAATTCTISVNSKRMNLGKDGWVKHLHWIGAEGCWNICLSSGSSSLTVAHSGTDGVGHCPDFYKRPNFGIVWKNDLPLEPTEMKACDFVLKKVKKVIQNLPDCP